MSFPYTTTSPPPTSGALTVVDKANVSQAYAGGGGGGGGGPNLAVSTLTVNGAGAIYMPNAPNSYADASIVGYSDLTNTSTLQFNLNGVTGYQNRAGATAVWSVLNKDQTGQYYGDLAAGRFAVLGNNTGTSVSVPVISADTNGQMQLQAVSTINMSTPTFLVNGQPVGGAVPANLSVSSLTVNATGASPIGALAFVYDVPGNANPIPTGSVGLTENVIKDSAGNDTNALVTFVNSGGTNVLSDFGAGRVLVGGQGTGNQSAAKGTIAYDNTANLMTLSPASISSLTVSSINGAAPGGGSVPANLAVSTITFPQVSSAGLVYSGGAVNKAVGINLTPLTGQYGNSGVVGAWGEEVYGGQPGWAEFATQRLYVTDSQGAATNATYIQNIGNTISVNAPQIVMNGPTSVSSLTVSSINGAAPGGGGGMVFSTVTIPGGAGSAFNSDPNVLNQIVTFPIIPNHVYNVNVDCRVQANAPTVTDTDNVYIEILPNGGTSQAMDTAWGVQVSTLTSGSVYTQVGGSALFKAPVNAVSTCSLGVLGSFSTTVRVDSITYVDMGAI